MGFFKNWFGHGSSATRAKAEQVVAAMRERTMRDFLVVGPEAGSTGPLDSKIGGRPYLPAGFAVPRWEGGEQEGRPLRFLAQLNFAEMPRLEGFPGEGILQFYVGDDEHFGLNFEEPTVQRGFRVVYHERVGEGELSDEEVAVALPVRGEARLRFETGRMGLCGGDCHFDRTLLEAYNEVFPAEHVPSLDRLPEELINEVYASLTATGHRVGGYPDFSQLDPREYHEALRDYTTVLLHLESVEEGDFALHWGESGMCNFLARPGDVAGGDFSRVLYNWDCY